MALRLVTGSSGQGKTTYMIEEVIRLSQANPGQKYYVIVPEQFSLEMQQKMVEHHPKKGYFNIDVLSFHRLAYRIFDECGYQPKDILEDLGVSLLLRKIMAEHEKEFLFFKKSRKKAGFIEELKSMLMEFIGYGVSGKQLVEVKDQLNGHENLQNKCVELGKIYQYFEKEIEERFMVTEQILSVAREFVSESAMVKDVVFYLDGFTGFTPVQLSFLSVLLTVAKMVTVTIPVPQFTLGKQKEPEEELFFPGKKTADALLKICAQISVPVKDPVLLHHPVPPRYLAGREEEGAEELAFLERHIFRSRREVYEKEVKHLRVTVCRNPEMEADYIMHHIERLVRTKGYRYRDFAILTGDSASYASPFWRKAQQLDIALFEDAKKKMSYHSGVEAVRALFHLAEMDCSYESVFRYLKSGMSWLSDEETDYLENYVLAAGIRGYRMWKQPFTRGLSGKREQVAEKLEKLRLGFLQETESCFLALRDKNLTVLEKMAALFETMVHLHFEEKFETMATEAENRGEYVKAREYQQLYGLLLDLLDKITGIFGEEKLPVGELSEIMDGGLEALGLGVVPLSMDQVIFGDLKRTRLHDIKVLFIAGMNDGKIPPELEDQGILKDEEKKLLEDCGISLADTMEERSLEDEFRMYLAFAKPEKELVFSYCAVDGDGMALRPSSLFGDIYRLFPKLQEKKYPEEEKRYYFNERDSREFLLHELYRFRDRPEEIYQNKALAMLFRYWYENPVLHKELENLWEQKNKSKREETLSPELSRELFGEELVGSVTRLERFAACPYQYYCIYGLHLQERDEYKIRPMDLGNLFHQALDSFSKQLKASSYTWKNVPQEVMDAFVDSAVGEALDENKKDIFQSTARNEYKLKTVTRILRRTIQVLKRHLRDSAFEPDRFELHFGKSKPLNAAMIPLKNGTKMQLMGTIDRVDICEEGEEVFVKIIDYKSGRKQFEMSDFYHGLELQLVIYMNAATEMYAEETGKKVIPAGIFYYQLKDPITKTMDPEDEIKIKEFRMSGYANDAPEILEKIEKDTSNFVSAPVRIAKSKKPYKNSSVMSTEDFFAVGSYARKKVTQMGEAIYSGDIAARPYKNERGSACDYCPYTSVCGFDAGFLGDAYREFSKQSAAEVLEEIRKQEE